jgi:heme O synthase-like polyprenyltransferase
MLPVVVGVHETKKSIFKYSIALAVPTLMLFTHSAVGWVYLAGAAALSLWDSSGMLGGFCVVRISRERGLRISTPSRTWPCCLERLW